MSVNSEHTSGQIIPIESCSGDTITIAGDWTNLPLFIGQNYCFRYRFSPQYLRKDSSGGGLLPRGRVQFKRFDVDFQATQHFQIEVSPKGLSGTTYTYTFGDGSLTLNGEDIQLTDDSMSVPFRGKLEDCVVDLVNCSPYPSNFVSATLEGEYQPKARGIR